MKDALTSDEFYAKYFTKRDWADEAMKRARQYLNERDRNCVEPFEGEVVAAMFREAAAKAALIRLADAADRQYAQQGRPAVG